jgi:hypothetical protein
MAHSSEVRDWATADTTAIRAAREYGIDLTLLVENLRHTPTERLRKAERFIASALKLRGLARAAGPRNEP